MITCYYFGYFPLVNSFQYVKRSAQIRMPSLNRKSLVMTVENVWPSQCKTNVGILQQVTWRKFCIKKVFLHKLHLRTNEDWVMFLVVHMAKSPCGPEMPSWTGVLLECWHQQGLGSNWPVGSPHPTTTCRSSFRTACGWVDSMLDVTQGTSYSGLAKGQRGDSGKS